MNAGQESFIDLHQLVAAVGDAVLAVDREGIIVLWNPAAARIFGFSTEEALGQSLDIIIPERLRQRHNEGFAKTVASGQTRYGESVLRVPAVHKDGRNLSIAFTVALLHAPEETGETQTKVQAKVRAVVAVVRDETEKWQEERQLRARLKACEEQKRK